MIPNEHDSNGDQKGSDVIVLPLATPYKGIYGIRGCAVTQNYSKGISTNMKESKITVRPTSEEYGQIRKRAESANMSVNRYLIESALHDVPGNDHQCSILMGQLCRLENIMRGTTDFNTLQKMINRWRHETMHIMEGF